MWGSVTILCDASINTMPAYRSGRKEEVRGRFGGAVNSCHWEKHGNWRITSNDKAAELDFIRSLVSSVRRAPNPAAAGPRVQIPPPQPHSFREYSRP
jgi:hypothetical protein